MKNNFGFFTPGQTPGTVTLNGGGLQWAAGSSVDISDRLNTIGPAGGTLDTNGNFITFAYLLRGGVLTKTGAGHLAFFQPNTHACTLVTGGTIWAPDVNQYGTAAKNLTLDGGGIRFAFSSDPTSRLAPIGPNGGTFDTNLNTVTFGTALTGGGAVKKAGQGTLVFTVPNTHTGGTQILNGFIRFNALDQFGSGGANVTLSGGSQWATGSTVDISSRLAPLGASNATFDTNGNNVTLATAITSAAPNGGVLTKSGAGTLTLTGTNTDAPRW